MAFCRFLARLLCEMPQGLTSGATKYVFVFSKLLFSYYLIFLYQTCVFSVIIMCIDVCMYTHLAYLYILHFK